MLSSSKLREKFIQYFQQQGHTEVASSSLVPSNDATLLFTNAGMVQFKDVFLGQDKRPYTRAVSSQRCVRAGGKHNDLDNVGHTARHHTFFEMLGNFSFGDYFKREAIQFAWNFLTKELGLPAEKLWVTVFTEDDEAADIWLKEMKVDPTRFSRCGEEDNFWSMGATGPCGPCSEIFYDHGPDVAGGPPGTADADGDRYIEIWNLVFMQYDRAEDGSLTPLAKPCVDTGMGLERISAVLQGVHNNYDIDLFQSLVTAAANIIGEKDLTHASLRVIADHIRSCAFLIVDGVVPSNEGRGYVLRRIIRRAIRHGHKLGVTEPFFYRLVQALVNEMGVAYPELKQSQKMIEKFLKQEEVQFNTTLDQGLMVLDKAIAHLEGDAIPGELVFKLYDTYGFPEDLTADIAREKSLLVDHDGFKAAMKKQREQSRSASKFGVQDNKPLGVTSETKFTGYRDAGELIDEAGKVIALYYEGQSIDRLEQGQQGIVVLDQTAFYAESGGQVADQGELQGKDSLFQVADVTKEGKAHLHHGAVESGCLTLGEAVKVEIDVERRRAIAANHSATHLLHYALRHILGKHVQQKGSLVSPNRLRFDFSHFEAVTSDQLKQIEAYVNKMIRDNAAADTALMSLDAAKCSGAIGLFEDKYGDKVRVLTLGKSIELCGGTHVNRTGDIGLLKIISETGIAAGVRRIEAVTAAEALQWMDARDIAMQQSLIKTESQLRDLEKQIEKLNSQLALQAGTNLAEKAQKIQGIHVIATQLEGVATKDLRVVLDKLKDTLGTAVIILAVVKENKVSLIAGVTKDCIDRVKAGDLVNMVAKQVGGKGGGRPDMAQAGGNQPQALPEALASVFPWVETLLSA